MNQKVIKMKWQIWITQLERNVGMAMPLKQVLGTFLSRQVSK
jgi:hypothetical protein